MSDELKRLEDVLSLVTSDEAPPIVSIETDSLGILEHTMRAFFRQSSLSKRVFFLTLQKNPYEPFLTLVRELFAEMSLEQRDHFFSRLSLPLFVKQLLLSMIFQPENLPPPFYFWYFDRDECLFFQKEILKGLREILVLLYQHHHYVIILRCTNEASFAFFDFVSYLLENPKSPPLFLLMDTRLVPQFPEEQSLEWNMLFQKYQKQIYSFEFIFSDNALEEASLSSSLPSIEEVFLQLKTSEQYWAWRDVKNLAEYILKHEDKLSYEKRVETLTALALSLAIEGSINEAIFAMERALSILQEYNHIQALVRAQILQAYFYLNKDAGRETALKIARHTVQLCPPTDKTLFLTTQGLLFACGDFSLQEFKHFYHSLVPAIRRLHPLFYLFLSSNYYFAMMVSDILSEEKTIRHLKKNLSLAKKYGHLYRQTFFLHHIAIFYSRLHDYPKTVRFYKKSIQLRQKLGDLRKVCHAYNGFGYVYFAAENFHRAFYYYNRAIKLNIELRDYRELCMSLMNVVQLEMILHNYDTAEELLSFLIDLKKELGIESLPIHSNTKITTLHTYLLEKLNKFVPYYHQASEIIAKTEDTLTFSSHEEYAYLQWFLARYYQRYINSQKVIQAYEEALSHISQDEFNYNEMEIWYDYLVWLKTNQPSLFENQKKRFLDRLQSLNLYYYQNYLLERHVRPTRHHYPIPKEHILETARLYAQINQVQHTLETLDFMNQLQKILLRQKDKNTLIIESLLLIRRYILVDFIVCYLGSHRDNYKNWSLIYSSHEVKHLPPDLYENIRACFTTHQEKRIIDLAAHYMKLFFPQFHSIMYFPLFIEEQEAGCIFFANRKEDNAFSEQTFREMHMAIKQINTMLANLIYAEMLHHTAQTDMLTGCANRLALRKRLEEEEERVKRSEDYNFSVVFTDMDNFKYYNDTFGHSIGDAILQEVALFLQQNIRKVDLLGRFGGDEFVLVLPDTHRHKALLLIQRLYQKMQQTQFFEKILSHYIQEPIPTEKSLSISMGIADYKQAGNLQRLLEFADIALYEAKNHGKNKAVVYRS
ncbi:MAG: diguanylate cyclase [Brevinematales bacterium]|nr:diguanylate cyclase [Brevinematales bacterium]